MLMISVFPQIFLISRTHLTRFSPPFKREGKNLFFEAFSNHCSIEWKKGKVLPPLFFSFIRNSIKRKKNLKKKKPIRGRAISTKSA